MTSCPECESDLDIDVEEVEEGDVVACAECGTEYEIVGVEPLELSKVEEGHRRRRRRLYERGRGGRVKRSRARMIGMGPICS